MRKNSSSDREGSEEGTDSLRGREFVYNVRLKPGGKE